MSYWVLTVLGHVIPYVTAKKNQLRKNTGEWSQQMREYNITIERRLDVKDADLSKDLAMVDRHNKLTIADEDPELLDE